MKTNLVTLALILLAGCVPVRVVDYQKQIKGDMKAFKTFSYYQTEKSGLIGPNFENNLALLKTAITKEMNSLGFQEVESGGDLFLNIGIAVKEEVQTRETDFRTDGMRYMGQRNYHWESQEVVVDRYKEGTVKIDLVDAATNKGVWTGSAAGTVTEKKDKAAERINKAIEMLFKKLPATK
ncbi:MAG: DUF4136 domain-containing protein [Cyclobacteriaceae bacterium]|nr:DUF4136 domain-containing protein [Cyclobacteriaceae bacterium]